MTLRLVGFKTCTYGLDEQFFERLLQRSKHVADLAVPDFYDKYDYRHPSILQVVSTLRGCTEPTPVSQINGYTSGVENYNLSFKDLISQIGYNPKYINMGSYVSARNGLVNYLNSMPTEFCISPVNQAAFDALNAKIGEVNRNDQTIVRMYESNFLGYRNAIFPGMNTVIANAQAINAQSRDFTSVSSAYIAVLDLMDTYELDIWNISNVVVNTNQEINSRFSQMNAAVDRALYVIEDNLRAEATRFKSAADRSMAAVRHWDDSEGYEGYLQFLEIIAELDQKLIPDFNAFLSKVPATDNVKAIVAEADVNITAIEQSFLKFPTFLPLPASSADFPHARYGDPKRKYGNQGIIDILKNLAKRHRDDTGELLLIGDLGYEHGGKASPHASHRKGADADIDSPAVGRVGGDDFKRDLAIALAKRIVDSGSPTIVFYADNDTIKAANEYAGSEIFKYEVSHTGHFHIRA